MNNDEAKAVASKILADISQKKLEGYLEIMKLIIGVESVFISFIAALITFNTEVCSLLLKFSLVLSVLTIILAILKVYFDKIHICQKSTSKILSILSEVSTIQEALPRLNTLNLSNSWLEQILANLVFLCFGLSLILLTLHSLINLP